MAQRRFVIVGAEEANRQELGRIVSEFRALAVWLGTGREALLEDAADVSAFMISARTPDLPAAQLCRRLRRLHPPSACALIVFGAQVDSITLVQALDGGADLCWSVPLNLPVCLAYLRAILRRVSLLKPSAPPIARGGLSLDPQRRVAVLQGRPLTLRCKEFDLLYALASRAGTAVSRDSLMREVWGTEYSGTTRTIDFHVSQLRQKLGDSAGCVETVPGIGYRFASETPYRKLT
ncbi:MAG: response regulator transcription factor [Elusimicrobia bacterium]|nr:response regulator transcription factor [Elusimicrobiota bacterium]